MRFMPAIFGMNFLGEAVVTVDLSRYRRQFGFGELPYRLAHQFLLVGQLEVHVTGTSQNCRLYRPDLKFRIH